MNEFGYAGKILKLDLSTGDACTFDTSDYIYRFLGGRGIAAKMYWDQVPPETRAFDEGNCLICMTGLLAGFTGFAGCRWQISKKGAILSKETFEKVKGEYYTLRGWNLETGLQNESKLLELNMMGIARDLKKRELLKAG